ncbi:hypothetical protein GALMADRAFT_160124 [Galerina marginata CBS 339.88]|uniref:NAD-dependent epimerase/dehydratase domain-containing protein n=1 Tax=Galerina marginata (strain CBS 339.88) TaxID=685588 RepID=A0A067SGF1_GALM3|nr:hypothetical protein GALMADRAFT_160124 [Galerina marginata CBS 339.88]
MPPVEPHAGVRVLVTGSNGYLAMWVVQNLLEKGYTVRGSVRSEAKGKSLKDYFKSYGDKFEWVVVEDIVKNGAFDEAVKNVDAIEHMASPIEAASSDPDDFIVPAVQGTVGILQSAQKYGNKVKRVVLTSSVVAVASSWAKPGAVYDENDWSDDAVQLVKEQGKDAAPFTKYAASKNLAEKAAWDFYEKHKAEIGWDLVTLEPPYILGPSLQKLNSLADLGASSSLATWWDYVSKEKSDDALKQAAGFIYVEDIAAAHVVALRKDEAGGQRMIISAGDITWQGIRDILYASHPELYDSGVLPRGNSQIGAKAPTTINREKGKRILGLEYRNLKEVMDDTLAYFSARGWVGKPVKN